ncbi:MAG: flagellar protein FliS [Acidibacillus sp.]|nr:flagellar protein FliS [Acidibacillus sp.]
MNPHQAYRNSFYTTSFHTQLAQLHRQAGVFTQMARDFIQQGDIASCRQHIQYVEDIIAFLRTSLDLTFDAAEKTDAVYAFYYRILVDWFMQPEIIPNEFDDMIEFWQTWAETWIRVQENA